MSNAPLGALAWIDGVPSAQAARTRQVVYDLSRSRCQNLPARTEYWFMVNHLNADTDFSIGFFALRVVARAAPGDSTEKLFLYRNDGWFSETGTPLPAQGFRVNQIGMRDFLNLHSDGAPGERDPDERLGELKQRLGGEWHAKPAQDQRSSWNYRIFYSSTRHLRESAAEGAQYYWAGLLRFLTQGSTTSNQPVIFNLTRFIDNNYVNRFWISVVAPTLQSTASETEIRIDTPCEAHASPGTVSAR
jgi:hypothetical protein